MRKIKDTESNPLILYLSGVFDIGGCVKIEIPKKGAKASLYVWVTSKHFSLMEFLQSFGAYVSRKSDGQYRAKWRDKRAYDILKAMVAHLKVRKDQAICGLEFWEEKQRDPELNDEVIFRMRLRLLKNDEEVI
jgi:uncharacterized protein YuzE